MNNDNLYITNANDYEVDPILNRNNPSRRPITGTDPAARTGIAGKIKNMFNRNDNDNDYNRDRDWNNRSFTRDPHHYEYTTDDKIRYDWERANKGNDLVYNPGNSNFRQDYWDSRDYSDTRNPFARSMFDKNLQYRNDRNWYNDNWNYSNRPFVSDKVMNRDTDYDNRNWNDSYYDNDYNRKPSFMQKIKGRVGSSGYSGDYTDRRDRYAGVPRNYNRRGSNSSSSDDSDDENRNYSRRNRPTMMEKIKRTIPGMGGMGGMGGSRSYDRGYGMNDWNRSYGMNDWNRGYGMNDWNRGYDNNDWHRNYWSRNPDWGYQPSLFDRLSSRFGGNHQYPMDYYNASASSSQYGNQTWYPNIDIFEDMSKNMYCFCVELPGVNKNELHVDIDNERLIVWGEKTSSIHTPSTLTSAPGTNPPPLPTSTTSSIASQVHKSECPFGRFYRTVVLPRGVDSTQVQAWLENGILYINVPKPIQTLRPGINISDTRPMTSTSAMSSNIPSSNLSSNLNQQGKTYQGVQDSNAFSLGSQGGKSTQTTTQTTTTKLY